SSWTCQKLRSDAVARLSRATAQEAADCIQAIQPKDVRRLTNSGVAHTGLGAKLGSHAPRKTRPDLWPLRATARKMNPAKAGNSLVVCGRSLVACGRQRGEISLWTDCSRLGTHFGRYVVSQSVHSELRSIAGTCESGAERASHAGRGRWRRST